MLVKPRPEILQNRFFLLETQLFPLFIITGILFVNGVFHGKQPIAVLDSLYCRLAVASYVISVRRIKSSLTASFRFYLTIDTLAVQLYTSLSPRRVRDFHPLERAHGAQTNNRQRFHSLPKFPLNRYPTPRTVCIYNGCPGSSSIFSLILQICRITTL